MTSLAIWTAPQSQQSLWTRSQCSMEAPNLPKLDRRYCAEVEGVETNRCNFVVADAHDSVHLTCIQCSTDSCGRAVQVSSLVWCMLHSEVVISSPNSRQCPRSSARRAPTSAGQRSLRPIRRRSVLNTIGSVVRGRPLNDENE